MPADSARANARLRLRQLVKRRAPPEPPLFVPLAYATAAQIEHCTLDSLLLDPTRMCKALTALRDTLATDAIIGFSDAGVLLESLGATLDRSVWPPAVAAPPQRAPDETVIERLMSHPRVAAGLEVVRRLAATAPAEALLATVLSGPLSLAEAFGDAGSTEILARAVESLAPAQLALARALCEAGAHLVILQEGILPEAGESAAEQWRQAMTPIVNVVRFYQALPVVVLHTAARDDEAALTLPNAIFAAPESVRLQGDLVGEALAPPPRQWRMPERAVALITTAGEIGAEQDVGDLREACLQIKARLASR
jgi:uroporphyrinogen-III decarboxylase